MSEQITIPFDPEIGGKFIKKNGKWGVIIAHGERSRIDSGILPSIAKKLAEKDISTFLFEFPFRKLGKRRTDDILTLDNTYATVWKWLTENHEYCKWILGGHGIGAETAIRVSGLVITSDGSIPPVISLNYPLYPPNKPERVDTSTLGAVMGDILFIQAENSNQGTFNRLRNSVGQMVGHAEIKKVGRANQEFDVAEKTHDRVGFWISNDIDRFLKNIS